MYVLVIGSEAFAQSGSTHFKHIGAAEGLPSTTVYDLVQDRYGFVWIATHNGICRYDGYACKIIKHDPFNPNSLSENYVRVLYEDPQGIIWIGTNGGGLNRFDPATGTFAHFRHDPNDPSSLSSDDIGAIYADRRGTLWVGCREGTLDALDPRTGKVRRHQPVERGMNIHDIHEDADGSLWLASYVGLTHYRPATGEAVTYAPKNADPFMLEIVDDSPDGFWMAGYGGLYHFDRSSATFDVFPGDPEDPGRISRNYLQAIARATDGGLWYGTRSGGLAYFDPVNREARFFRHDPHLFGSLSNDDVRTLLVDRSGMVWIGTLGGGLNVFHPDRAFFSHFRHDPNDPASLSHNTVQALYEDSRGRLWVGTYGNGLNVSSTDGRSFRRFTATGARDSLSYSSVWAILEDESGRIWIATTEGLDRLDERRNRFVFYEPSPEIILEGGSMVTTLHEDRKGQIWLGTHTLGLNRFEPETGTFTRFKHDPADPASLSHDEVWAIHEDHEGFLWVGTEGGGLNQFDPNTGRFTRYLHRADDSTSLSQNSVWSIREDARGDLWIGTASGLNRFDRQTKSFSHYFESDGLPDNAVVGILSDEEGMLWISTMNGLCRFDPESETFRVYDEEDGLRMSEFTRGTYAVRRDGTMLFGGTDGFVAFHPDRMQTPAYVPPVRLTRLLVNNRPAELPHDISVADALRLTSDENFLTFEFAALDFADPRRHRYRYRLVGLDEEWVAASRNSATYTNLQSGAYRFEVRAAGRDGLWNEKGASVGITVLPPWWRTAWAYGAYGILIAAFVFGAARAQRNRLLRKANETAMKRELEQARRIQAMNEQLRAHEKQLERQNAQLEEQARRLVEMDGQKSRFFANISHEFRTPLTLILGPIQDALADAGRSLDRRELGLIHRNSARLLRLINQLLDLSKLDASGMHLNPRRSDLVSFLRRLTVAFTSRAERDGITLMFSTEVEVLEVDFDPDKLENIVTNLLSNAFKYTPAGGTIDVNVCTVANDVFISLKDTGDGISEAELPHLFDRFYQVDSSSTRKHGGTGIGLALTRELVELHGGTIEVESKPGIGSTFTVCLPIRHAVEEDGSTGAREDAGTEYVEQVRTDTWIDDDGEGLRDLPAAPADAPTILIVEDNVDMQEYLRSQLQGAYRVVDAVDGADGLRKARESRPDLVISDVMMPEMDGFSLCEAIKSDDALRDVPVVLLTAKADADSKLEGLETGADAYLTKPFSAEELLVRVENLIEIRRMLRERYSDEVVLRPSDVVAQSADAEFIEQVREIIETHIGDSNFGVEWLAAEVGLSARQLQRRIKALTSLSAAAFIRYLRMHRAAQLLEQNAGLVSEIAYQVGFQDARHFSKQFRESFGELPSEYGSG